MAVAVCGVWKRLKLRKESGSEEKGRKLIGVRRKAHELMQRLKGVGLN